MRFRQLPSLMSNVQDTLESTPSVTYFPVGIKNKISIAC